MSSLSIFRNLTVKKFFFVNFRKFKKLFINNKKLLDHKPIPLHKEAPYKGAAYKVEAYRVAALHKVVVYTTTSYDAPNVSFLFAPLPVQLACFSLHFPFPLIVSPKIPKNQTISNSKTQSKISNQLLCCF